MSARRPPLPADLVDPHPERVAHDHPLRETIVRVHRAALAAGAPGYPDPATGLFVLTAVSLWDRNACCGNGCRHCPYLPR